jgi:hypothetical protein
VTVSVASHLTPAAQEALTGIAHLSHQIGSTVLQNELGKRLPADYLAQFPEGLEIIYAVIPTIKDIKDPLLEAAVKKAFADSLQLLCSSSFMRSSCLHSAADKTLSSTGRICIPISGAGLLVSLLMRAIPLHSKVDAEFGYQPSPNPRLNDDGAERGEGDESHALAVHTVPYGSLDGGLSSPSLAREKEWDTALGPSSNGYVHYSPPKTSERA